jgi:uncharacterized membrane protein YhaH (DUF805 family)
MRPTDAIFVGLKKSFQFSGRATRSEYWWFALAWAIATPVLDGLLKIFWSGLRPQAGQSIYLHDFIIVLFFVPFLAVTWRRMHDINYSGWMSLFPFVLAILAILLANGFGYFQGNDSTAYAFNYAISLIPAAVLFYWHTLPSTSGPNRFVHDPHSNPNEAPS